MWRTRDVVVAQARGTDSGMQRVGISPLKRDPAWKYVQVFKEGNKSQIKCIFCGKMFKGGGIYRVKEHLAGITGNGVTCTRVPPDVRILTKEALESSTTPNKGSRKRQNPAIDTTLITPSSAQVAAHDDQYELDADIPLPNCNILDPNSTFGEPQDKGIIDKLFNDSENVEPTPVSWVMNDDAVGSVIEIEKDRRIPKNASASTITNGVRGGHCASASNNSIKEVHMAIGRFIYDVGLPPSAVNSAFFQPMVDAIATHGTGTVAPLYHELRGWILKNALDEVKSSLASSEKAWGRAGCSILVEEWSPGNGVMMVNIFVHCLEDTVFLKSVEVTNKVDSPDALFQLLKDLVEEVGIQNVLQVITGRDERFAAAATMLSYACPSLYWAPCAADSMDLVLEDFGKIEWINATLEQCKSMARFIHNSSVVLNLLRKYTSGLDLVEPGASPAVTDFKTLKRFVDLKQSLQALVTSQEWVQSTYSKSEQGWSMVHCINDPSFWSSCSKIFELTDPLLRVMTILGCKKRPAMGYIYGGIYRAKETIKKQLKEREEYLIYWNIIDSRWQRLRQYPLHAAGFYLNPKFFYSIQGDLPGDIVSGMFDCVEKLVPDTKIQDKIMKELNLYKKAAGDFGRNIAIRARDTLPPSEWWSTYGASCPNLSRFAVRILGQRCSLVHPKRDHGELILSTNNSLERLRLSDLAFTHFNLRLLQKQEKEESDVLDPYSFNNNKCIEHWTGGKQLGLEDNGISDWTVVTPPSCGETSGKPLIDDAVELDSGFDDYEIFVGIKYDAGYIDIS